MLTAMRPRPLSYLLLCVLTLGCLPCAMPAIAQSPGHFDAIDLRAALSPDELAMRLASKRVVFIGETHNRYGDHLNQLALIERLHTIHPDMAIGVEYFQQPFQQQVDDYIDGRATESEFLRGTGYFEHWGFDYRLYAPIFRYAREQHIPVRALNVPESLPSTVARVGIKGLSKEQRTYLPRQIEPAGKAYRARLREAFQVHTGMKPGAFDHFVEAQLVWDEGMAASAASYLEAHPDRRMVILAGSGHLAFGDGIPKRLERRTHASYAIVLNGDDTIEPKMADYVLLGKARTLPAAGALGVGLDEVRGECRIRSLIRDGAAQKAGLRKGDVLVAIDGQPIKTIADVHVVLWDKKPGNRVRVEVRRRRLFRRASESHFEVMLAGNALASR